jgi:predicted O-methyltransferase YrrM
VTVYVPNLHAAFPHTDPIIINGMPTVTDRDFNPGCGYISDEEAAIIYQTAQAFPGTWVEVGAHTGWSGAHIALGAGELVALEPMFYQVGFFRRARENWGRAGVWDRVLPIAYGSDRYFAEGGASDVVFSGAFIDGDHEPGMPLQDARLVLPRMSERCCVAFHDFVGPPVREAVTWLVREQGFRFRVYDTMGMLAVCWRGDFAPVEHAGDPGRDWQALREQHVDFDYAGET